MDFVLGALFGATALGLAVAISITDDPYYQIRDFRIQLGLEDADNDGDGNEKLS